MKTGKIDIGKIIKNFIKKYNIILNYYLLFIVLFLIFTFILIRLIGVNVLNHEAYILRDEFIKKNQAYTFDIAEKLREHLENLDTLSVVDLIEKVKKEDGVEYVFALNSDGEVIAHSIKSELFKKYSDIYVKKRNLGAFIQNITKVWHKETEYKGKDVIKFSKPIILEFAKEETLKELQLDAKSDSSDNNMLKKFYIAGALHVAFSTEKLKNIFDFSQKRINILYLIAIFIAIVFGYFTGLFFETTFRKADTALNSLISEKSIDELNTESRYDTPRVLFSTINKLIAKYQDMTVDQEDSIVRINQINETVISELSEHVDHGVIIANEHLKVGFINTRALDLLSKKKGAGENINEILDKHMKVVDDVNKLVSSKGTDIQTSRSGKNSFYLIPIFIKQHFVRFLIVISSGNTVQKIKKDPIVVTQKDKKVKSKARSTQKEEEKIKEKKVKDEEDPGSKISSRLRNI
ncbi:MAG: hypothetical protein KKH98_02890 [Spirochaetes bacterium]|nr:hypothetical protein [Spirochaetota bacterium]